MNWLVALVLSVVATTPEISQLVRAPSLSVITVDQVQHVVPTVLLGQVKVETEQTLETSVEDPKHPKEPWIVTTYRVTDESLEAFIKRHRDTVDAVRAALKGS